MGQLEKYGLYVLCLVIFLILGVAIWGGDPTTPPAGAKEGINKLATSHDQGKAGEPKSGTDAGAANPQDKGAETAKAKEAGVTPKSEPENKPATGFAAFLDRDKVAKSPAKTPGNETTPNPRAKGGEEAGSTKGTIGKEKVEDGQRYHVVQHGDTLHDIAVKELGSAGRVSEILALNPGLEPRRMRDGLKIKLPAAKVATDTKSTADAKVATDTKATSDAKKSAAAPAPVVATAAKAAAGQTYKVKHGDTLTSISRVAYGNDKHVKDILAANRGKLPSANVLRENMVLSLPAAPAASR